MGEVNTATVEEPEKKRRIPCDYPGCDKSFLRSEHLSRHQLNHYGRTLECDQCGKKFARSDLLHRHLDRHRHQQQKMHAVNATPPQRASTVKNISSPYATHHRTMRSLSADEIPRSFIRDQSAPMVTHSHYNLSNHHVQPILPAPAHGPTAMPLQGCITPMQSIVPGMPLPHEYGVAQPMFASDIHHSSNHANAMNGGIVIPAGANSATLFDMNTKWDHLFQGGGIFDMSVFSLDSEFGNLTPPDISLENITTKVPPYQSLISAVPTSNLGEFTLSPQSMEKLKSELPEFYRQQRYFSSTSTLAVLLEKAFFHINNNYPIFHRPTIQIENFPSYLILAIASFGALLSDDQESQHFGLALHGHVRDFIFSPIMFSGSREIWVLQTMLLINIAGNHLGKRLDHEMSDILQGTMVTLARRNSVIFDDDAPLTGKRSSNNDETKWHDWVKRECIKRFAHFIFINDTQHSCVFGHQGVMSVWEMKVTMPCSDALWTAPNAQEWRRIMSDERKARSHEGQSPTLSDIVAAFVCPASAASPVNAQTVPLDGLGLYAVVHGIFSMAWHYKYRKMPHHWANMMNIKIEDQGEDEEDKRWLLSALHTWKSRYNHFWASAHYPMGYQPPSGMWSPPFRIAASALYDLACIWMQVSISDIQMAAGLSFSRGRAVSKQRAQQSWIRVNKTTLNDDICHHALNLVEAELLYKNESAGQPLHSYLTDPSYPLFMPFLAYLGGLVLWSFTLNLEPQQSAAAYPMQQRPMVPAEQNSFPVDTYGMSEFPRVSPSVATSQAHFQDVTDHNAIIQTLRRHLSLSPGNADNMTAGTSTTNPGFNSLNDNELARLTLFKQGIEILLSHLKDQLDGHRWEIATEGFEILQGTTGQREYQ